MAEYAVANLTLSNQKSHYISKSIKVVLIHRKFDSTEIKFDIFIYINTNTVYSIVFINYIN